MSGVDRPGHDACEDRLERQVLPHRERPVAQSEQPLKTEGGPSSLYVLDVRSARKLTSRASGQNGCPPV